nr:uncharacterized protein LOC122270229 [Parasteatoda tepidariorum]
MEEILFSKENAPFDSASFLEKAKLSPEDISSIEMETRGQSSNWKWARYRKFRLTASNFGFVIKAMKRNSYPKSLFTRLEGSKDLSKIKQIQWGLHNEKAGVSVSEKTLNVSESGLWLESSGLLGASPVGFFRNQDGSTSILEVKCPFKYREDNLNEKLKLVKDYILHINDDVYVINNTHDYYHQMQGQLAISNAKSCSFGL